MKTIAFFNNKGGVGKTTLVYHIAWMCAQLGNNVMAVDLDPQSNLTSMFFSDNELATLWPEQGDHKSILRSIKPILEGLGDIGPAEIRRIRENLHMIPGDLGLSLFEDRLSENWPKCLDGDKAAFRALTAFYRIVYQASQKVSTDLVLLDVGPNLGAINRAVLIASDYVVMPLAPGLFSLQGLRNLGPTLTSWRNGWKRRLDVKPKDLDIFTPSGSMKPLGYIIMQHVERKSRPVKSFQTWVDKIPRTYSEYILQTDQRPDETVEDTNRIGLIKNYQSLMPMAQDARKPIFLLKPADGAIGAHAHAVQKCYMDFKSLTVEILSRMNCN